MKQFLLAAAGLCAFATANAQTVTLNVKLSPIQTLLVNPSQNEVNLNYNNEADYLNGVSDTKQNQLTIYSTGGFQVKVRSGSAAMENGGKNIQTNSIKISASQGSNAVEGSPVYTQDLLLTQNDTTLVSSDTGGVDRNINVKYAGAGGNTYVNNYILGQNPTTYTTTLTYTIVAK